MLNMAEELKDLNMEEISDFFLIRAWNFNGGATIQVRLWAWNHI